MAARKKIHSRGKTFLATLGSLLLGFSVGLGGKILYEVKSFQPYSWDDNPPIVLNCYGEDFSELQMVRAIDYWVVRGYNIGFYEHNPPPTVCEQKDLMGFIILRKGNHRQLDESTLASTKRKTFGLVITSAEIIYRPGSFNLDLINEHELGHAFGFNHVEEVGHIMHPLYHKMGKGFWKPE